MARLARLLLPLASLLALLPPAHGQAAATKDASETAAAPAPRPKRDRPISDNLASSLAATMPKYQPPPKPKPEDADVDLRDIDKPKNGIIRLPKYTVRDRRPPVFRERDVYTRSGLADLARRRYVTPGYRMLNSFYIPFLTASPEQYALARYAEDERLATISDLTETARDVSRSDRDDGLYLKRVTDETFMRSSGVGASRREP